MDIDQLPSNSNKSKAAASEGSKQQRPKKEKVVKGSARKVRESEAKKIFRAFIEEDLKSVLNHVLYNVVIPKVKNGILDAINDGVSMLLNGKPAQKQGSGVPAGNVSYRSYYSSSGSKTSVSRSPERSPFSFANVTLVSREDAEEVLDRMREQVEMYETPVSVADFYDLVGVSSEYTDAYYGWDDLDYARVVGVRDGWQIQLPRPRPIR